MNNTCFFTGHRKLPKNQIGDIVKNLKLTTERLIKEGITEFILGGAVGFDLIAASIIVLLRDSLYPQVKLVFALPCKEQSRLWSRKEQTLYNELLEKADEIIYTSEKYFEGCMHKRNRFMVEKSGFCICCLYKETGGTAYTVRYAKEKGIKVFNVFENLE